MATLEKIRKRSTMLLIVVGVALLAFIVGDFFTSGRTLFGSGTTIAKVGNHKIDIQEFQRRYEQANQQYQQQNTKVDPAQLQQSVLYSMVQEQLFADELAKIGIEVTDNELTQAMLGPNPHYAMLQLANQMGFQSPRDIYDLAYNPSKFGDVPAEYVQQAQAIWLSQEKQMEQMLKQQKLQNLIGGAIVANDLDARAYYDSNASTTHIAYVRKGFSELSNDDYPVTADDIRAEYNKDKNQYKVKDELRRVNYITVNITPSQEDVAEGRALVDATIADMAATADLEAVNGNSNFGIERVNATDADINNPQLLSFVKDSIPGSVKMISYINDEYTIAKLLNRKQAVDSVNIDIVAYQGDAAGRDSILAALNSGKPFEEVLTMTGVQGGQADIWERLASTPDNDVKTAVLAAGQGYFIADSTDGAARIMRVNTKKAPVTVYDYATVTYKVYPSDATITKLNDDLNDFIAGISVADSLTMTKALTAGYSLMPAMVSSSSATLGNVPYTRAAVKWAMDANKGQISPVIDTQNDMLVVVAVDDIIKPGFVPAGDPDIRQALTEKARNNKKAAALINEYKGKANDLAGYAAAMKSTVDSTTVSFGQMFIPGIGAMESQLLGQVPVTAKGALVGPVQGNNGVYVYMVYDVDNEARPYSYEENSVRYDQQFGNQAVLQKFFDILLEKNPVENNTLKFYND